MMEEKYLLHFLDSANIIPATMALTSKYWTDSDGFRRTRAKIKIS